MPKISELPVAATPLLGTEELACVQNGATVQAKASDLANIGIANFALIGEVKSVVGQPLVTVIDKSIAPTWFGAHKFNAGINIGTGGDGPDGSSSWFDSNGDLNLINISCNGGGYFLDFHETLFAASGYTVLVSQDGPNYGSIEIGKIGDLKNYYRNDSHSFENLDGSSVYMHADATGVGVGTDLGVSGNVGIVGTLNVGGDVTATNSLGVGANLGVSGNAGITGTLNVTGTLTVAAQTVAALGAATAAAGALTRVSDGQAGLALGAVVTGGGTAPYLVWSNGTAWTIIGH